MRTWIAAACLSGLGATSLAQVCKCSEYGAVKAENSALYAWGDLSINPGGSYEVNSGTYNVFGAGSARMVVAKQPVVEACPSDPDDGSIDCYSHADNFTSSTGFLVDTYGGGVLNSVGFGEVNVGRYDWVGGAGATGYFTAIGYGSGAARYDFYTYNGSVSRDTVEWNVTPTGSGSDPVSFTLDVYGQASTARSYDARCLGRFETPKWMDHPRTLEVSIRVLGVQGAGAPVQYAIFQGTLTTSGTLVTATGDFAGSPWNVDSDSGQSCDTNDCYFQWWTSSLVGGSPWNASVQLPSGITKIILEREIFLRGGPTGTSDEFPGLDSQIGDVCGCDEDYNPRYDIDGSGCVDADERQIIICAIADINQDGTTDYFDYLDFIGWFGTGDPRADFNHDDSLDYFDYLDFIAVFDTCNP